MAETIVRLDRADIANVTHIMPIVLRPSTRLAILLVIAGLLMAAIYLTYVSLANPNRSGNFYSAPLTRQDRSKSTTGNGDVTIDAVETKTDGVLDYPGLEALVEARQPLAAIDVLNLRDAAIRGGHRAARILYRASERCASAPRSDEELQTLLNGIRSSTVDLSFRERQVASESRRYLRCLPFAQFDRNFRSEVLERAASSGDNEARLEYFYERPITDESTPSGAEDWRSYRARLEHHLTNAMKDGEIAALSKLSDAHRFGVVPSASAVKSYEYLFAYALARGKVPLSADGGYAVPREGALAISQRDLSAIEISQAEAAAVKLVESCCSHR